MAEMLTTYDRFFNPMDTKERGFVHTKGLWHAVVHCWVCSHREDGDWIWFQKRAHQKKLYPDFYDTAVGGHIAAGERPIDAVLRETREELGLCLTPESLQLMGIERSESNAPDGSYADREFCYIFYYAAAQPPFAPGEEVADMIRVRVQDWVKKEQNASRTVQAVSLQDGPVQLSGEEFCHHSGEFFHWILPKLRSSK